MPRDPLIGLVGKPSSGKSTTLNRQATYVSRRGIHIDLVPYSLTDASSKVGKFYPFHPQVPLTHKDQATSRVCLHSISLFSNITLPVSRLSTLNVPSATYKFHACVPGMACRSGASRTTARAWRERERCQLSC
jgi:hypothetical protein